MSPIDFFTMKMTKLKSFNNNKTIPIQEVHRWWKNCFSGRNSSFEEFKKNLVKVGYTIIEDKYER